MGELTRVLPIATAQEAGMEDASALGLEASLHAIELAAGRPPRLGRAREERLLIEQVRAEQRIVTGELERLRPSALPAQLRDSIVPRHATV